MIRGLFPRLFGQFREGGILIGQFTFTGSAWTPTALSHVLLSCADRSAGLATLTLRGGARKLVVMAAHLANIDPTDVTDARFVQADLPTLSTNATIALRLIGLEDPADDIADPIANSVLTVVLYADK